jgi:hypothetical protein
MARFKFGRPISLRWNGLLIEGPAETTFEIPDEYYEEFNEDIGGVEPTLVWLDSDEGATVRARVTALESAGAGAPLSNSNPIALGTAAPGTGTSSSRNDHVHPTTGLALSGHNHSGVYDPAGTAASAIATHVAAADPHSIYLTDAEGDAQYSQLGHTHAYLTDAEGDAQYSQLGHTHTSFANNLQINKSDSKLQLLNTTSGSGTEDGMYLLMADTDVGYLWNAETNGALVFGTGGAERARITPAGKFGIGTNAPAHQLEVVGPSSVTVGLSAGGSGFAELELVGQAGKNYITSDDTLSFDIGGTERATVATTGLDVTSGTLSQGGTAVSLSGHTHSTSNITSGNFAATVSGGTGVTVTGGTGNASTPSIAIGQAVGTGSNVQFNNVQADGYVKIPNVIHTGYSLGGSATSTTITTAGTYYALTSQEVSFTPAFVGQKFLVTYSGYVSINTTTIQYSFVRVDVTDSSNTQIEQLGFTRADNFGTSGRGQAVSFTDIWTADSTSARKIKLYGTNQTTNGLSLTTSYTSINVIAIA